MKLTKELQTTLEAEGYILLREIDGRGICGLQQFMFTIGIVAGIDEFGLKERWCYPKQITTDAILHYQLWDGVDEPTGGWIKYKGIRGEHKNPESYLELYEIRELDDDTIVSIWNIEQNVKVDTSKIEIIKKLELSLDGSWQKGRWKFKCKLNNN